jgi:phosphatidylglycerophosphatase B
MRDRFSLYKKFFLIAVLAWLAVMLTCFFTPIAFSCYSKEDTAAPLMYWISESGGVYGTTILLVIISLPLALAANSVWKKVLRFIVVLLFLGGLLGTLAYTNEYVVKPAVAAPRPSHMFLEKRGVIANLESFYSQDEPARADIIRWGTKASPEKIKEVYPAILEHWMFETGFSFPSGHSQNAFLLATLVSFLLFFHARGRIRYTFLVPVIWAVLVCISRVAIGIHTKYDVTAGAATGLIIAAIIILTGLPQKMMMPGDDPKKKI